MIDLTAIKNIPHYVYDVSFGSLPCLSNSFGITLKSSISSLSSKPRSSIGWSSPLEYLSHSSYPFSKFWN